MNLKNEIFFIPRLHHTDSKLFILFSNGKADPSQLGFGGALLKALLENLPYLPAAATGGRFACSLDKYAVIILGRYIFSD